MVGDPKPEHPLHHHRPPLSRQQLLMQFVVAGVILISGIGIGAGGTVLALRDRIVWHIPSPPPDRDRQPGPRPGGDIVEMLRARYNLTDEQVQKVKELFAKRLEAGRTRWEQLRKIEADEREQLVQDMKGILTPEQFEPWRAEFTKMTEEAGRRPFWGPRGDRRGPPHGDRSPGPDGWRGGRSRERFGDPNGPRMGGSPRPIRDEERRGNWPPRGPMDPNGHHKDRPAGVSSRPGDANAPK